MDGGMEFDGIIDEAGNSVGGTLVEKLMQMAKTIFTKVHK